MRHFQIEEWVDFVRGVGEHRAEMDSHLASGCRSCDRVVCSLREVTEAATAEAALAPPPAIVRSVQAFFALGSPNHRGVWKEVTLERVFDSSLAPAAAASRTPAAPGRRMLFESDRFVLELSVEPPHARTAGRLKGQLLEGDGTPRSQAPVFLVDRGVVTERALTEGRGTFEMPARLAGRSELWLFVDDGGRITVELPFTDPPATKRN